ncbi:MAG: Holliday junction branch migration protein RuvA [bacterium]
MISFIKGILDTHSIQADHIILENNGIGYKIFVSQTTINNLNNNLSDNNTFKVFTHTHFSQDNISLFGFLNFEELQIFQKLITVSGVGVKSGLSLLDCLSPQDLITAILSGDTKALCLGHGIGKKASERIILELKDKVDLDDVLGNSTINLESDNNLNSNQQNISEATEALISLGFSKSEVLKVITSVSKLDLDLNLSSSKLIALCLKKLKN